jgi:hypothetical protein
VRVCVCVHVSVREIVYECEFVCECVSMRERARARVCVYVCPV